jgi:hypothetical protein
MGLGRHDREPLVVHGCGVGLVPFVATGEGHTVRHPASGGHLFGEQAEVVPGVQIHPDPAEHQLTATTHPVRPLRPHRLRQLGRVRQRVGRAVPLPHQVSRCGADRLRTPGRVETGLRPPHRRQIPSIPDQTTDGVGQRHGVIAADLNQQIPTAPL